MTQEIKILVLHNASSIKEEDGVEVYHPYSQDLEIVRTIKKLPYKIISAFYEEGNIKDLAKDQDLIFNLCDAFESPEDEIKMIQELEENKIPYTGNSSLTSINCQDKFVLKNILKLNKIKTPEGQLFKDINQKLEENLIFPLILKPIGEDGSEGIDEDSIVFNEEGLRKKLSELFVNFKKGVLAEEYIEGREFNVPIIGNETPFALPLLEIDYNEHFDNKPKILTYKAKWSKNSNAFKNTYSNVAKINDDVEDKIDSVAVKAYKTAKCTGYGSIDLRMNDKGEIFVIEVNPNCYLAPESDIVKAARHAHISYEQLLDHIIKSAIEKFNLQKESVILK